MIINVRENEGEFFAALEGSELEGVGETALDALRELVGIMEEQL